jgi:hypothetical protein
MASFANTNLQIAQLVGISEPTLLLRYRKELEIGRLRPGNAVKMNLYKIATGKTPRAVRAIELWLRLIEKVSEYQPAPHAEERQPWRGKKEIAKQQAEEGPPDKGSWAGLLN